MIRILGGIAPLASSLPGDVGQVQQLSRSAGIETGPIWSNRISPKCSPPIFPGDFHYQRWSIGTHLGINKLVGREFEPKSLARQPGVLPVLLETKKQPMLVLVFNSDLRNK